MEYNRWSTKRQNITGLLIHFESQEGVSVAPVGIILPGLMPLTGAFDFYRYADTGVYGQTTEKWLIIVW